MFKLTNESDLEKIKVFCRDSAFGAYISCRAEAYGFNAGFSELWISEDERGKILCAVSSLDKNAVVLSDENCNFEELSVLIDSFGFKSILTDVKTADNCSLCGFEKKAVLKLEKCENALETNSNPDLKSVYELYCSVFPKRYCTDKESYLTWLSDFTFRKKCNLADIETVETEGTVVAAAMTAAESETSAVIASVACKEGFRKKGFGKKVVLSLASKLTAKNKNVFVISENDEVTNFYRKIGFEVCGFAAYIERQ